MKYLLYIIIGLAAVALFYFGIFNREQPQPSNSQLRQPASPAERGESGSPASPKRVEAGEASQQTEQPVNTVQGNWETKTDDQPPVTIKVTPIEFGKDMKQWKFAVIFDTHSGSLDQDPTAVISLSDNNGNTYRPIAWEGPGPGGHHREGVLIFAPVQPLPKYVELKIKDVGDIPERSLRWNLE